MREAGEAAVIGSRSRDSDARVLLTEGIAEVHLRALAYSVL